MMRNRMKKIDISVFHAKCSALLEEVSKSQKSLLITRQGKPIVEIVPISPGKKRRLLGACANSFDILDNDIVGPIIDFKNY